MNSILQIPLDDIAPFPGNRRVGGFDQEKLEQLAASIRDIGVQQPAIVRKGTNGTAYELVAGERRWRASRIAGADTLPCLVKELTDTQALKVQLIENLQRDDVHPLDECHGFAGLLDTKEYDVATLSKEVGRSPSYIYQRLKLRDLTEDAEKALLAGEISGGHALLIARLPAELQPEALDYAARETLEGVRATVRELAFHIESRLMLELGRAGFKKDDPDLIPAAGPCTMCPKRTGRQPELFGDVASDRCMDAACFNAKLDALVDQQRADLESKGTEYLEAASGYIGYKLQNVLGYTEWSECKKKDDGAKRVLIAAGPDRGRLTWGKKYAGNSYQRSPQEKAKQKKQKEEEKRFSTGRARIWQELMTRIEADPQGLLFSVETMRLIVLSAFSRLWVDFQKPLIDRHGWERRKQPGKSWGDGLEDPEVTIKRAITGLEPNQLLSLLFEISLIGASRPASYGFDRQANQVEQMCSVLGIPSVEIERQVRAEFEAKKERKR